MLQEVKPDQSLNTSKRAQVEEMFNQIAPKYDFLNRFLSLGIDRGWRKKAINSLKEIQPKEILDVATGTADLALEALRLKPNHIIGVDIAVGMLDYGRIKIANRNVSDKVDLMTADSEALPFAEGRFDAVTVAFGVRNFQNLSIGISEMHRVLRHGGRLAVLEFSKPSSFPYKQIYNFYFSNILPLMGNLLSKSKNAYTYLPESVRHFPEGDAFAQYLSAAGFRNIQVKPLTFGTCTLYIADK